MTEQNSKVNFALKEEAPPNAPLKDVRAVLGFPNDLLIKCPFMGW